MDLFSTLQLLHEAVMSVLVTTIYGRWRGTITRALRHWHNKIFQEEIVLFRGINFKPPWRSIVIDILLPGISTILSRRNCYSLFLTQNAHFAHIFHRQCLVK